MIIGYDQTKEDLYGRFEKESTDEILRENDEKIKECGLFYVAYPIAGSPFERYRSVTFMTGPISIDDNISFMFANQAAKKNEVSLTKYDFGRCEDEEDERDVFCIECFEESEISSSVDKLKRTQKMLDDSLKCIFNMATA